MSTDKKIPKRVIYKRAEFSVPGLNLQKLLNAAFQKLPEPSNKTFLPTPGGDARRWVNAMSAKSGCLCFELLQYESGKDQILVTLRNEDGAFPVDQEPVQPAQDGSRREILESSLYVAVHDNHMAVCQSAALRTDSLEKYLHWFLFTQAALYNGEVALALVDEPTQQAKSKILRNDIKAVRFGDSLTTSQPVSKHSSEPQEVNETVEVLNRSGLGYDILTRLLREDELKSWRQAAFDLDPKNIRVKVEVSYVRKTNQSGQSVLRALAQVNRHHEENSCEIELVGGTKIRGDELRIQGEIRVDGHNGVPIPLDIFRNLAQWLRGQVSTGSHL
jgi:hypothetical protein